MEKISVVIPLYNKLSYIERALKSVLGQTVAPDEIIVVDDGSTDGGGLVVENLNNPTIRLVHQQNQGEGAARNRGVSEAHGGLIAFLDADDAWKPRFLEVISNLRRLFPQAGAYATAYERISPYGTRTYPQFNALPPGVTEGLIPDYFKAAPSFPVWSSAVAIPKNILEEIGAFPVNEVLGVDLDTWLRVALRYHIAFSSETCSTYYQNIPNRVNVSYRFTKEPAVSQTARQAIQAGLISSENIKDLREYISSFQLRAASHCLMAGEKDTALQLLEYSKGSQSCAWWWRKLRIMAALPGNAELWSWKIRQELKRLVRRAKTGA